LLCVLLVKIPNCSNTTQQCLHRASFLIPDDKTHYARGGQTAAREPRTALRTFACGSLGFPKYCLFVVLFFISIAKSRNIVKWH